MSVNSIVSWKVLHPLLLGPLGGVEGQTGRSTEGRPRGVEIAAGTMMGGGRGGVIVVEIEKQNMKGAPRGLERRMSTGRNVVKCGSLCSSTGGYVRK